MKQLVFESLDGPLEYSVTNRPRVTKRLHMEIDARGRLVVVAPRHWSPDQIRLTLSQNAKRVQRFLCNTHRCQPTPLKFVHGELHFFLGETYPLRVGDPNGRKTLVTMEYGAILIRTARKAPEDIQCAVHKWYRQQALGVFQTRFQAVAEKAPWASGRDISLRLRKMKRTWGNCSSGGVIKLNTQLIKAPQELIDYVIAHELCHLREMNHGRAFYTLQESLNPDWRSQRDRLRSDGYLYLR